jgi:hypothetical protein
MLNATSGQHHGGPVQRIVSHGEISFAIEVDGDTFTGTAVATFYDSKGKRLKRPTTALLSGQRILP